MKHKEIRISLHTYGGDWYWRTGTGRAHGPYRSRENALRDCGKHMSEYDANDAFRAREDAFSKSPVLV